MFEEFGFTRLNVETAPTNEEHFEESLVHFFSLEKPLAPLPSPDHPLDVEYHFPHTSGDTTPAGYLYPLFFAIVHSGLPDYYTPTGNDVFLLAYIYQGEGLLEYKGNAYHVNTNDGFLIPYNSHYRLLPITEEFEYFCMHFGGSTAPIIYQEFTLAHLVTFTTISQPEFIQMITAILTADQSLSPHREYHTNITIQNLLHTIIYQEEKEQRQHAPASITQLMRYMEEHYSEALSLEDLSKQCGLSKYHLSREFKRYTDYSPNEYLIYLRMHRAQFLIINTDLTIAKIAEIVGIPNESNFRRLFMKQFGKTPSQLRKKTGT